MPHLLGYRKNCTYPLLGNLLSDLLCHAISNGRTITIIVVGSKVNEYGGVNDGCVWGGEGFITWGSTRVMSYQLCRYSIDISCSFLVDDSGNESCSSFDSIINELKLSWIQMVHCELQMGDEPIYETDNSEVRRRRRRRRRWWWWWWRGGRGGWRGKVKILKEGEKNVMPAVLWVFHLNDGRDHPSWPTCSHVLRFSFSFFCF